MAAASPWTHDQVAAAFRRAPELKSLLLHDVEETGETLGSGSYGVVVKLRVAGTMLCAGKKIHETLIDQRFEGAKDMVMNFFMECKLMSNLRHPNIVQFLGVWLKPSPVLVTELLTDCLHNFLDTRKNLPLPMKLSFLTEVVSALVYMHSGKPPVIHRDLTAKNVLIDERSMKAKITDLGNSRFIGKHMTRAPGTLVYMPPEALDAKGVYGDKLDMFSFGHLGLFTLTQVYPEDLLAPNIPATKGEKLISRSEVERRAPYIELLNDALGKEHPLVKLTKQCLSNDPQKRPTAMQALESLEDYNPDYEEVEAAHRTQMLGIIQQKDKEIFDLKRKMTTDLSAEGILDKLSIRTFLKNRNRKWKPYTFKLSGTHLRYSNTWIKRGEILLSTVTNVFIAARTGTRGTYCFEIHFDGDDSPWILAAKSVEERRSWIDMIRENTPKVKKNEAYGVIPDKIAPTVSVTATEPEYEAVGPQVPDKQPALPHRPADLGKGPSRGNKIKKGTQRDENREKRSGANTGKLKGDSSPHGATRKTPSENQEKPFDRVCATLDHRAPNFTPHQIKHLIHMLNNVQKPSNSDDHVSKEEKKKRETTSAMDDADSVYVHPYYVNFMEVNDGTECSQIHTTSPPTNTIPRLSHDCTTKVHDRGRQPVRDDMSQVDKFKTIQHVRRSRSASPPACHHSYINYSDLLQNPPPRQSNSQSDLIDVAKNEPKKKSGRRESPSPIPPPKPSQIHKSSSGFHLTPGPAHGSHKEQEETLKNILKQSTLKQDPESLLITEEDNSTEDYILCPKWAKASTSRPGPHTLAALHRKGLYISPRLLTECTHLGEGRFGMVYKAEMRTLQRTLTVAVKSVANITNDFRKEVTIMSEVVHPNIIRLYGLVNEGDMAPAMVMEYLPNGDLKEFLSQNRRDNPQLMKYMIDVAMGMHYLSDKGIIHRDLAARNVLVDKNEMCKVADFGLVREVPRDNMIYVSRSRGPSPLRWMAPESMTRRIFSPASDIWSYGILQWEMFNPSKLYPYPNLQNEEVTEKVTGGYLMPTPRHVPPLVVRIMKACWNSQPNKRPSFLLIANILTGEMIGSD